MEPIDIFLAAVKAEYLRACVKFPINNQQNVALMEEVGELAKAMLDLEYGVKGALVQDTKHFSLGVMEEAVQVASMAAKVATLGDSWCKNYDIEHALTVIQGRL